MSIKRSKIQLVITLFIVLGITGLSGGVFAKGVKHLIAPDSAADCYECHKRVTPKIAQNWLESKHGVTLMKCFVCHGEPGGKGSVPFSVKPDPAICAKCHDPAMKRMKEKFGVKASNCYSCHPYHQNSIHHEAYGKSASKK